jgi:hypothetical protein
VRQANRSNGRSRSYGRMGRRCSGREHGGALERQQEAAEVRRARKDTSTTEERERKAQEESLRLSRARIEQLGRATNPAHRAMLERALKALDAETTLSAASE